MNDPIVEEVRKIREDYLKEFNYDLEAIFRDLKAREQEGDHKVVSLSPKRIQPVSK